MFGFENLKVYQKSEVFYKKLSVIFSNKRADKNLKDQLKRSSSSILLNIAEGSAKFSTKDKRNFYVIARGSASESVATLNLLKIDGILTEDQFIELHALGAEIGRMLTGLIRNPG